MWVSESEELYGFRKSVVVNIAEGERRKKKYDKGKIYLEDVFIGPVWVDILNPGGLEGRSSAVY